MRPDVKLGLVISMTVVFVAGVYYFYRDSDDAPIPVSSVDGSAVRPAAANTTALKTPAKASNRSKPVSGGVRRVAGRGSPSQGASKRGDRNQGSSARRAAGANPGRGGVPTAASAPTRGRPNGATAGRPGPGVQPRENAVRRPVRSTKTAAKNARPPRMASGSAGDKRSLAAGRPNSAVTKPGATSAPVPKPRRAVPLTAVRTPAVGGTAAAVEVHRVQAGDTFESLAERYYGDSKLGAFLRAGNHALGGGSRLLTGQRVRIPPRPEARRESRNGSRARRSASAGANRSTAGASRQRTYQVQPGDSFYSIARRELGDASRFQELFELNRSLVRGDPKRLRPGQLVKLP